MRYWSCCERRVRAIRSCSRSRCQATVASSVSSCGTGAPAEHALRLGRPVGPAVAGGTHLGRRERPGAAARPEHGGRRLRGPRRDAHGRRDAREPAEIREQPLEGEVPAGEQVALAHFAAQLGHQVAGRRVAHVHDPDRPVRVHRDPAEQEAPHEPRRGEQVVARAEADRRVHADERQPVGRHPHRLDLRLVHRVDVRDAEPRRGEQLRLGRGLSVRRRADRRRARRVDHTLDLGAQALLHHELRAAHVHVEQELRVRRADGRHARAVKDLRHVLHRAPHRTPVAHLQLHAAAVEVRDRGVGRALLNAERHVVAAIGEQPGDVGPDEAGRSRYEHAWQGGRV